MVLSIVVILSVAALCNCSPIRKDSIFKEAEYDVTLNKVPGQKSYFVKKDEMPIYEQQFAKIKELGEEIDCKITGNCGGSKRGYISKKSMFDESTQNNDEAQFQDQVSMNAESMGGGAGAMGGSDPTAMGGEDVSASMMAGGSSPSSFMQKNAASFGQQPQMDIKLSKNEMSAATAGYGHFSNPMGPNSMPSPPQQMGVGNDALMKLRDQQNSQAIDGAIQDKLSFMDKANGPPMAPPMQGMPDTGISDPLSQFSHSPEGKDDMPGSVSENDLMKAEDIQPNEIKGITNFLKDSNHMDKPSPDQMINDAPSEDGAPSKTNVDFGGQQANIENEGGEGGETPDPMNGPNGPVVPGGPEVPTLNNLGLGMNAAEMGPPGMPPSLKFVQDSTRHMIQQNSDYKVPNSALSNLWNSYMSSSQGVLGEKDPSANSRQAIWRPIGKTLHRRSNVERVEKASLIPKSPNKNIVYIPAFVIKNVLKNIKKSMETVPESQQQQQQTNINKNKNAQKNTNPPIYITEKQGKRFLVINPSSPTFVEGFADVDHQYAGFKLPLNNNLMDGFPLQQQQMVGSETHDFGTPGIFPAAVQGPWSSMKISGMPILRGQTFGGVFRGYMAVPVLSRLPVNGFSHPLYPSSQPPLPYNNFYHPAPPYFHQAPRVDEQYPLYHRRMEYFNHNPNIQPYPRQHHFPYYPNTRELDRTLSSFYSHQQQQLQQQPPPPQFGLEDYHYIHDEPGEEENHYFTGYRVDPRLQLSPHSQERFPPAQPHHFFEQQQHSFTSNGDGVDGDDENKMPSLPLPPAPPIAAKPFQFEDIHESEMEANKDSMFSSYFNGPFGEENHFDNSNAENQPPFGEDNQMVKRSRQQPQQHHQGPYVFTKEHVGFGPITVEAHTASYKGSDPKDDDN